MSRSRTSGRQAFPMAAATRTTLLLAALSGCSGGSTTTPVVATVASVSVTPGSHSMATGDTLRLTATARDAGGSVLTRSFTWSSANPALVTVSGSGLVTAVQSGGPVSITATAEGHAGSASVTVQPGSSATPIATLQLDHATVTMALRQGFAMTAVARDAAGQVLVGRTIAWTSSNAAIASVGTDGAIAGNQAGTATITAAAEGQSASATVTVIAFTAIAAGFARTCAISEAKKLYCAGTGTGSRAQLVSPNLRFASVFGSGTDHDITCAIATDEALYCWGTNASGELGIGDPDREGVRNDPSLVTGNLRWKTVAMGRGLSGNHTCGLTTTGDLYCWGAGESGQLGTGAFAGAIAPVAAAVGMKFSEVAAGRMYTCGIAEDGLTYCWGDNSGGHLGLGTWNYTLAAVPSAVHGQLPYHGLTGAGATCALTASGVAYCWGDNTLGKLGYNTGQSSICDGDKPCSTLPAAVGTDRRFSTIQSSLFSTCALEISGSVYCWGMNFDDKFGTDLPPGCAYGAITPAPCTVTPTLGPVNFAALSTSRYTTCGIRKDGGAFCWGGNETGQLGYPGVAKSKLPVPFTLDPDTPP